jgi:hypothetical protein
MPKFIEMVYRERGFMGIVNSKIIPANIPFIFPILYISGKITCQMLMIVQNNMTDNICINQSIKHIYVATLG